VSKLGDQWRTGGTPIFEPLAHISSGPYVIRGRQADELWEIGTVVRSNPNDQGSGNELVIRHVGGGLDHAETHRFPRIPQALAGMPALGSDALWLALRNGDIYRQPLNVDGRSMGVSWKSGDAAPLSHGDLLMLDEHHLISTDGISTLTLWRLTPDGLLVKEKELSLGNAIMTAPIMIPAATGTEPSFCVATTGGDITVVRGTNLQIVHRWHCEAQVTAGPFIRGKQVACVVNRKRLVLFDLASPRSLWQTEPMTHAIVGEPQLIGDGFLIADQAGHYITVDAVTGQQRGNALQIRGSAGPATAPTAFGEDRAFVPLTDGTVMLLGLRRTQEAKR
jgi:hypothetical protein